MIRRFCIVSRALAPGMALCLALIMSVADAQTTPPVEQAQTKREEKAREAERKTRIALQEAMVAEDWELALKQVDELIAIKPNEASYLQTKGNILREMGRVNDALRSYQLATKVEPKSSQAWNDLCWNLTLAKNLRDANTACVQALSIDRRSGNALRFGHTFLLAGESKAAYRWYQEAVDAALFSPSRVNMEKDLLGDFDVFIKRGWRIKESKKAKAWMVKTFTPLAEASKLEARVSDLERKIVSESYLYETKRGEPNDERKRINTEIVTLYEKILKIQEKQLKPGHAKTILIMDRLAAVYDYEKAVRLRQRGLAISRKVNGSEHPTTVYWVERVAALYDNPTDYKKSRTLRLELIAISDKTKGPEHPDTIFTVETIANHFSNAGDFENELPLKLRMQALVEKNKGAYHSDTMALLDRIAALYRYTDNFEKAGQISARVKTLRSKVETRSAPDEQSENLALSKAWEAKDWPQALNRVETLIKITPGKATDNLSKYIGWKAYILGQMERREEAVMAYQRKTELAPEDESGWNNLCWQMLLTDRAKEARSACERSVSIKKTSANTVNLGHSYLLAGEAKMAYQHYHETVKLVKSETEFTEGPLNDFKLFIKKGWETTESRKARDWMIHEYALQEKRNELNLQLIDLLKSKQLAQFILINERNLPPRDEQVIGLYKTGQYGQAVPIAEQSLSINEKQLGLEHANVAISLNNLAILHHARGDTAKALALLQRALAISEKASGKENANTGIILNNIALIHQELGEAEKALPLMRRAFAITMKVNGPKHAVSKTQLFNLATLYESMPDIEKAVALYSRILETVGKSGDALREFTAISARLSWMAAINTNEAENLYASFGEHGVGQPSFDEHQSKAVILDDLAAHRCMTQDFQKAMEFLQRAYLIREKLLGSEHPATVTNLYSLALLHWIMNRPAEALTLFERYVEIAEKLRNLSGLGVQNHQKLFAKYDGGYKRYAQLLAEREKLAKAFQMFELIKARSSLEKTVESAARLALPSADASQLESFQGQLADMNDKVAKAENDIQRIKFSGERDQAERELSSLHQRTAKTYPKYAQLTTPTILAVEAAAKRLPDDAVFVSYLENSGRVLVLTIASDGKLAYHDLGKLAGLIESIAAYRALLAQAEGIKELTELKELQNRLGKQLLEPIKKKISRNRQWIISKNGALGILSFDGLRLDGERVDKRHSISYAATLSNGSFSKE